ncbi:HIT family protein [Novilysobacter spongiicola]|uniref:Histidine triad (HIT) family protein n=1 Tax=Lysobacter spongiicola DSM 21749 TaxID=1122188 RepID=A0A1T4MBT1_9GAMM|nr:HIT family protein [Lysobacter spongiicola]SJZ64331.1 histidine triad (HIT) family protein [Lysobacter spongiicola DSM 21749]
MGESPGGCPFCAVVAGVGPSSIVCEDELAVAFIDLRQFNPGHVLVVPRRHLQDIRELDTATGAALMTMLVRVTRAVGERFQNDGLSLWHSIGEAAGQEVPHLHFHVHPRRTGDGMLQVYPRAPHTPGAQDREAYAEQLRCQLELLGH